MIRILFFARLRDEVGVSELETELPASVHTVEQLTHHLSAEKPHWRCILERASILVAVNQAFAHPQTSIEDGDEIAYFPPVTGG